MPALLKLLRAIPCSAEGLRRAAKPVDWDSLSGDARRHGLVAILQFELDRAGIQIPEPARTTLRRASLAVVATNMRLQRLLLKVLDAFAAEGIVPILLKGLGLATRIYPDPMIRAMSDLDLLIRPEDFSTGQKILEHLGFQLMTEATSESPGANPHHPRYGGHHITYSSPEGTVELHWRPVSGFSAALGVEGAFERCIAGTLEGRAVRYLSREDEVASLAVHAAGHLLERLGWLYDLKLLLGRTGSPDWDFIVRLARQSRLNGPIYLALEAAQRAVGADVPWGVLNALRPPWWQARVMEWTFCDEFLVRSPLVSHRYPAYILKTVLANGLDNIASGVLSLGRQGRQRLFHFYLPQWAQQTRRALGL